MTKARREGGGLCLARFFTSSLRGEVWPKIQKNRSGLEGSNTETPHVSYSDEQLLIFRDTILSIEVKLENHGTRVP